ncbi:hypothetical protein AL065_03885 [Pseudomonas amygdali pv. ulmi]|nr:hypothetical protein AL065_03885 [Pseudomonas amygdali pv. ulmi]
MNWETDGHSSAVKAWYQALCEQSALLDAPEDYTQALCVQANALHAAGEVEAAELVWCFTSTNENIVYAHLKPTRES